ncbi:BTB domain-containing protein [Mycena chlorophos]|uniref:BTB domain-containing protein n=1 Tax=Mycena chlorophos TaxID=658473 RepID=A0A8H6SB96_MYCCL|nr:BTB domain-containing protein [Mycena chlorophos]
MSAFGANPPTAQRVPALWFSDGNIVLQAGYRQFKVFHGILGARSPVFRDMLAIPQPEDAERIDGCPVVQLPDGPEETTSFLRAIYDSSFFPSYPKPVDLQVILGCLSLSHKYDVPDLRQRASEHLAYGCPTTLAERDALVTSDKPGSWDVNHTRIGDIMKIIRVSRVCAPWALPSMFLTLSAHIATSPSAVEFVVETKDKEPFMDDDKDLSFSRDESNAFLEGHSAAAQRAAAGLLGVYANPALIVGCTDELRCALLRLATFQVMHETLQRAAVVNGLIDVQTASTTSKLCATCAGVVERQAVSIREAFWEQLPILFGLPSWAELEAEKRAALGSLG